MNQALIAPPCKKGQPAWEIACLFPNQGHWDEEEYLALDTNHLVELSNGFIEVLPVPTMSHQVIVLALYEALVAFVRPRSLGRVLIAGLPVRLWKGTIREPDVVFMLAKHADRMGERYWQGADLAMEVVSGSPKDRRRDLKTKRAQYAPPRNPQHTLSHPYNKSPP